MEHDHDFSALRQLLALKQQDLPQDTQLDQFLTEFHRRQRAQLLEPASVWTRAGLWIQGRLAGLELVPSLSYTTAFAAIALTICLSLSQQMQVTQVDGQNKLTFRMPAHESPFAMVPVTLGAATPSFTKVSDNTSFTPVRAESSATRYVLATASHGGYDSTVAF